ncbi:UNVERIFIED_CONTAM: Protein NEN4 [Sesamum indicum]
MRPNSASDIVFFDLETTVPNRTGQRFRVLEFGAIVVCPRNLVELESYCTLIRPGDLSVVPVRSGRSDGIIREAVAKAPSFDEVADKIFDILDGRIWAGHNIQRFDCVRIREAFGEINRPAPEPVGIIDSLGVLTQKFGKRAGNMKMATLADYFGLGQQKHRSLEDVRLNLEVLKHCATVLLLVCIYIYIYIYQSNPDTLNNKPSPTRGKSNNKEETSRKSPPSTSSAHHQRAMPYARQSLGKMTDGVRNILRYAKSRPLNDFFKHSRSVIR